MNKNKFKITRISPLGYKMHFKYNGKSYFLINQGESGYDWEEDCNLYEKIDNKIVFIDDYFTGFDFRKIRKDVSQPYSHIRKAIIKELNIMFKLDIKED